MSEPQSLENPEIPETIETFETIAAEPEALEELEKPDGPVPLEADEGDVSEQAREVAVDEDEYR
ncbi:MAG: hypothetical protein ABIS86_17680 [Streptosporangiaceae bacterium]